MTTFADLGLIEPLLRALDGEGYTTPTPIQAQAIPHLLTGRDLLGIAQTGTGKTAAFGLPTLQKLIENARRPTPKHARVLVLTPTRELAIQIDQSFKTYGGHLPIRRAVVFGGVGVMPQANAMSKGVDILVATPGRLLDLMNQGYVNLSQVEVFILDEADRMLDMGFIHDVRKIISKLPKQRQTLLFSATMPDAITDLAGGVLTNPLRVEVTPVASTVDRIAQKVMFVDKSDKRALLTHLMQDPAMDRVIVFTRMKHMANRVAEHLEADGVSAAAIHGNKSQSARQAALASFKAGKVRVLVATDIAARGIDIDGVTHIVNFDLPNEPESYVHRIGRTARAGAEGSAISFCDPEERAFLRQIEKTIRQAVPVDATHPYLRGSSTPRAPVQPESPKPRQHQNRGGYRGGGGGNGNQRRDGKPAAGRRVA